MIGPNGVRSAEESVVLDEWSIQDARMEPGWWQPTARCRCAGRAAAGSFDRRTARHGRRHRPEGGGMAAAGAVALTDGGIETTLVFHEAFDLPCFASFPLLEDEQGRAAIDRYFSPFLDLAQQHGTPFVLDTATWRANPDWGTRLGYDARRLADANRAAVAFAQQLGDGRPDVTIN